MLFRLLLGVVVPGVKGFVPQLSVVPYLFFSEHARMIRPATTADGHGAGERKPLAAVALKDDMRLMPLVEPTEGDFVGFVVRFDVLDNLGHSLALSRRLTGLGRPAKGSVVVTVTILAQMVVLVKIFTREPRKIYEK